MANFLTRPLVSTIQIDTASVKFAKGLSMNLQTSLPTLGPGKLRAPLMHQFYFHISLDFAFPSHFDTAARTSRYMENMPISNLCYSKLPVPLPRWSGSAPHVHLDPCTRVSGRPRYPMRPPHSLQLGSCFIPSCLPIGISIALLYCNEERWQM